MFSDAPPGWKRVVKQRKTGKAQGTYYLYFYSPDKVLFRSKRSLEKHLKETNSECLLSSFNFSLPKKEEKSKDVEPCEEELKAEDATINLNSEKISYNLRLEDGNNTQGSEITNHNSKMVFSVKPGDKKDECVHQGVRNRKKSPNFRSKTIAQCPPPRKKSPYFRSKIIAQCPPPPPFFRRVRRWDPPRSPYHLIQENLYHDPWKLLVATIFLQRTTGASVRRFLMKFFNKFPTPEAILVAQISEISIMLETIGLQNKKAKIIQRFSDEYLHKSWKYPIELHGIGKYGNDSFRIFCANEWKKVSPKDHMLVKYHLWLKESYFNKTISIQDNDFPK